MRMGLIEDSRCYMLELLDGPRIDSSIWGLMMMGIQLRITLERYFYLLGLRCTKLTSSLNTDSHPSYPHHQVVIHPYQLRSYYEIRLLGIIHTTFQIPN